MVHPHVGKTVPNQQVEPAEVGTDVVQSATGKEETEVGESDQLGVLGLVQRAGGVEVVDTTAPAVGLALAAALGLAGMVVVTGDVVKKVHGPAKQLLGNEVASSEDGGLLKQLTELVQGLAHTGSVLLTGLRDEHHVTGDVTGGLVVLAVGDLPREVGDQQERVTDPANGVVQGLGRREGLVTALVGQDPETGTDETLNNGVDSPKGNASRQQRNGLGSNIVVEEVEDRGQNGHVPEDVVETGSRRTVEAVSGNSIADLLDGVVGNLELVAVGIQHLASLLLGCHGGQRCRGGRLAWAVERRRRDRAHSGGICWEAAVERNTLGDCGGGHVGAWKEVGECSLAQQSIWGDSQFSTRRFGTEDALLSFGDCCTACESEI